MPICMIIALDIVMTLRGSINCSTVICSPTVILAILREDSSEHYGPQGLLHTIFSALHFLLCCSFRLQVSLCKQSWRDWQPLWSVGCKLVCVWQVLWTWRDPPSGSIPWFSNWGKYLLLLCCITLSSSREKTNASLVSVNVSIFGVVVWEVARPYHASTAIQHASSVLSSWRTE